jgi:hypothetical protein
LSPESYKTAIFFRGKCRGPDAPPIPKLTTMICPWAEAELLVDAHLEEIGGSTDRTDDADRREERSSRWYADVAVFSERVVGDRVFDADPGSPPHVILWRLSAPPQERRTAPDHQHVT